MEGIWVLLSPLIAFLIIGLFGRKTGDMPASIIAVLGSAFSFIFSLYMTTKALQHPVQIKLWNFLPIDNYTLQVGFYFDPLSSITASVVTFVATLIFIYSIGYMHNEFGKWTFKFYAYLSLFLFAMLLIVLSDNLLGIFFGWEGVGLASYLLIGYYHNLKKATNASLEAFVMNRIGDWLFIFGIISTFLIFGTLDIVQIFNKIDTTQSTLIGLATLLLFGGAVGKSGQLPLHTWLPNAMAGPTPVSALLHAATMVAAGVYMVARLYPIFEAAPQTLKVVAVIGGLTALFAALAAIAHTDIKKIIAFSTMSQLGYMFMALGVGDMGGAMYHLTTHAFFKALLFLAAGSVITAFHHHLYDIMQMGGLKKYMPITYASFMVGALALAGIFPLSGFWSKDRIVASALEGNFALGVLGIVVAFMTAYYIFREGYLVFSTQERWRGHYEKEPHEVSGVMTVPMVVLGVMSVIGGIAEGWYMHAIGGEHKGVHIEVAMISVGVGVLGIVMAYMVYVRGVIDVNKAYESMKVLHSTFKNQFYTEHLYHKVLAKGYLAYSKVLYSSGERQFIDGVVNGSAYLVRNVGSLFTFIQNGKLNWYMFGLGAGGALLLIVLLIIGVGGG